MQGSNAVCGTKDAFARNSKLTVASDELSPFVYAELRRIAHSLLRQERPDHTLQATALVHEAFLRLAGSTSRDSNWDNRGQFFAAAAETMRRILIDSLRRKMAQKRGGQFRRIDLDIAEIESDRRDEQLLSLDAALERLELFDETKAQLVKLRFFSGMTTAEAAQALGISVATAERYWAFSRAWLQLAMRERGG
ncbi:MAG: sigma-70 family RNA polymerase sigma factor [Planctomycetales bacterium]|nr:sigma-70 family RNA polymerase sigma factor [Planctomycetales bacterium]